MIVRNLNQGYEIIFQRNHALLAGELARHLKEAFRPPRWIETLSAILEHDDGQTDWSEAEWITTDGHPKDYSERGFDLTQARKITQESAYKSTWIQLLVSMHTTSLCESSEYQTDNMRQFIKEQRAIQKKLRKLHSLRENEVVGYYRFLRWCDECSLILCKGELEDGEKRSLIIGDITSQSTVKIVRTDDGSMTVAPWCFQEEHFSVTAELFQLNQTSYQSTEELRAQISNTSPVTKTWIFKKNAMI
ncbi:DUF3891 family protein [Reichenbachiella agarivorans]|uniref:DUF3891 family protein n=1 Tax=Reichenbachiella agarivorans TaxID=2979464 RepID=A0ABY6CR82_9BACT|nr:DUF3891 family protein [Reichenbachiella agarivorans]UXP33020.1 DUF3891 family protein [Reichenbachiella agarivorans]